MRPLALAVIVVGAAGDLAHADSDLVRAHDLEAGGDLAGALAVVDQSLAKGDKDPDRLVELHLFAGTLAAKLDKPDVAEAHFARVLALRPGRRLAGNVDDKTLLAFEAASAKNVPQLKLTASHVGDAVDIKLDADPLHLVAAIRVRTVDAIGQPSEATSYDLHRVVLPAGTRPVEVDALDDHGNRLWVGDATEPPVVVRKVPWWDHWKPYAIATVGLVIGGAIFASSASDEQSRWNDLRMDDGDHDFTELKKIEDSGRRDALVANVFLGAASVFAVVTVVQLARHAHDPQEAPVEKPREKHKLRLGAGPGTAGVSLGWSF